MAGSSSTGPTSSSGNTALRRRPVRRASRQRGADAVAGVLLLAAPGRRRAGRRRSSSCAASGVDAVVTTVLAPGRLGEPTARRGTRAPWPRSACPSSRPSAPPSSPADVGGDATPGLARSTWPWRWPSPSSTGASSRSPSPSRRRSTTATPSDAPVTRVPDACPTGSARVAGLAVRLARLRRSAGPGERRVAIVLSAYPTKRSRLGNAVGPRHAGLGARPAAMRWPRAGYRVDRIPDGRRRPHGRAGRRPLLRPRQRLGPAAARRRRRSVVGRRVPAVVRRVCPTRPRGRWRRPGASRPATVYLDPATAPCVFSGLDLGGVLVAVQPPRGFGEHPVAVYHSPDLPPTHHYLAFYRWLDEGWGADAVVHVGKHGTLEWLPGKGVGPVGGLLPRRRARRPPARLPLRGQRPGRGHPGQAPGPRRDRRPPAAAHDPGRDLRRPGPPRGAARRARPGGRRSTPPSSRPSGARCGTCWSRPRSTGTWAWPSGPPDDGVRRPRRSTSTATSASSRTPRSAAACTSSASRPRARPSSTWSLAMTRLPQGGVPVPAPRWPDDRGLARRGSPGRTSTGWRPSAGSLLEPAAHGWDRTALRRGGGPPALQWVCDAARARPCAAPPTRSPPCCAALDGRSRARRARAAPRPGGWPTCCRPAATSTRVDPKAVPSRLAWEVGRALADALSSATCAEEGSLPARPSGSCVWGTAAMRTGGRRRRRGARPARGAAGLAGGVRAGRRAGARCPRPSSAGPGSTSRSGSRASSATPSPTSCDLLDEAVRRWPAFAGADDARRHLRAPKPGAPTVRASSPSSRAGTGAATSDLAAVYLAWGGWAYGRAGMGLPAGRGACAGASPRSRSRSRTRTTGSTTSSTPTTTSRTTAGWSRPSGR